MAPSGAKARFKANVAAIEVARRLADEGRAATPEEQQVLARWSSWGAIPQVFEQFKPQWHAEYEQLRELLDRDAYYAARTTTLNAHYTAPEITEQMWSLMQRLAFEGGRVLEPGCGSGTFIGTAPDSAQMVGIELDPTTALIAQGLYPHADVRAESFADTRIRGGEFDAVIGNVPFGDFRIHDRVHNQNRHAIHNHFIIKSLAATRPGGMVVVLTSRFTLDAQNPAARREMQQMADLVGAVRLPSGAHKRTAGTEAVTDMLVFRRRIDGQVPAPFDWERSVSVEVGETEQRINEYLVARPERVLGEFSTEHGMHGAESLVVRGGGLDEVAAGLAEAIDQMVTDARNKGLMFADVVETEQAPEPVRESTELWDGTITEVMGEFMVARDGLLEPLKVAKTQQAELRELMALRDRARELLTAEASQISDTPEMDSARDELRGLYERYVSKHGPLNRFDVRRSGRVKPVLDAVTDEPVIDEATGQPAVEEVLSRVTPPVMRVFKQDPHAALTLALELFDEESQTSAPAALLLERAVVPRVPKLGADTPTEAVALSLDQTGGVDLEFIADALGLDDIEQARAALGPLVFDDPVTGEMVYGPEYLSGNVRIKLEQAQEAALTDERFNVNVEALREVVPNDLQADEIQARMGAVWISPAIHQQFLREILHDRRVEVENPMPGTWIVRGNRQSVLATNEWGTERRPATAIAEGCMSQRTIKVYDEVVVDDRKRQVINEVETTAAAEKAEAMQERFAEWVWEDPQRAAGLVTEFNRRFNAIALRDYSQAGDHLTFPGLAQSITLRPHQRTAVARMLAEPAVGLFHEVGAGKTLEMVVGVTELKRLGLVSKPLITVPNHMLEQFTREYLQAYPTAKLLAASSDDLSKDGRRLFVARAAANQWDAIIMTHKAFEMVGVSPDVEADYIARQLAELDDQLQAALGSSKSSIKLIEAARKRLEAKLASMRDQPRDVGVTFEDMGVDYLVVDEAHLFKNLSTVTSISGAAIPGANRSTDLHLKLDWLRQQHGQRVATLATATPLANSITEAHVMQRYLRPDLLKEAGVQHFDAWAATFGEVVAKEELGPDGKLRVKERFARFTNVPEMLRMWYVFADVKTAEDLHLPVPLLPQRPDGDRAPVTVTVPATAEQERFMDHLHDRIDDIRARRSRPEDDNMLKVSTHGRWIALDMRVLDPKSYGPDDSWKIRTVARNVANTWRATRENTYRTATGEESPIRGGLQLVFCDLSAPNPAAQWDSYTELKRCLIDEGLEPSKIRFIHEANSSREKARLFAAARAGHISVLIGSTQKMGMGTNVQDRIVALHHMDCPWRPADLEQRNGRAIRQGNQNPEVAIYNYVTEGTFDAYLWQTVTRKATFIQQVMKGRLDAREMDEIGGTAMSAMEALGAASGDKDIIDKARLESELSKLHRQQTAHRQAQSQLVYTQQHALERREILSNRLDALTQAQERTIDTAGDKFAMTIDGVRHTSRSDAAKALGHWAITHNSTWANWNEQPVEVAQIGGHRLMAHRVIQRSIHGAAVMAVMQLDGVPMSRSEIPREEFEAPSVGTIRAMENKPTAIARNIAYVQQQLEETQRTLQDAEQRIGRPFKRADEMQEIQQALTEVNARLEAKAKANEERETGQAPAPEQQTPQPDQGPPPRQDRPTARPTIDEIKQRAQEKRRTQGNEHRDPPREGPIER